MARGRTLHGDRREGFGGLAEPLLRRRRRYVRLRAARHRGAAEAFPHVTTYAFISSISAHRDDVRAGATEDDDVYRPPFPEVEEMDWSLYGQLKAACEHRVRERYAGAAPRDPPRLHRGAVRPDGSVHLLGPSRRPWWRDARAGPPTYGMQTVDARDLASFVLGACERQSEGTFIVVTAPGRDTTGSILGTARSVAGAHTGFTLDRRVVRRRRGAPGRRCGSRSDVAPAGAEPPHLRPVESGGRRSADRPMEETIRDLLAWDHERGAPWPLGAGLDDERELPCCPPGMPGREFLRRSRPDRGSAVRKGSRVRSRSPLNGGSHRCPPARRAAGSRRRKRSSCSRSSAR